jgi:hypothetical protein
MLLTDVKCKRVQSGGYRCLKVLKISQVDSPANSHARTTEARRSQKGRIQASLRSICREGSLAHS